MRLGDERESSNVEDMRGSGGGGGFGMGRSLGIGSILIALVGSYVFGIDPSVILSLLSGGGPVAQAPNPNPTAPLAANLRLQRSENSGEVTQRLGRALDPVAAQI